VRPLDRLPSIKVKLGVVIVATVVGTVLVLRLGARLGLELPWRVLVASAIGLLVVQFLARGTTSPLREMAVAAKAMARGDHDVRVTATSRDEVGELARAFNSMAAQLADVDRQRRELVANVSHELRTPIGALQALLENLADGVEPPDRATLRVALAQTERLGRLVGQLLDLSRMESGALPLRPVRFPVRPLLEQALRECTLGDAEAVRLKVSVQPGDLVVEADPERMHQVVANLLDNAIRHSPPEGRVWLSAHAADAGVTTIAVSDEGPGIPEHEAQRVFERFYRTDEARSARDGGTGLGLAIARWIVDAHGGAIRAERRDPHGCRVVVELPR
jgi:signal transduction histidine kinase